NSDATTRRLSESHDVQVAAAYFAQDVEAAGVHDWTPTGTLPLVTSIEKDDAPNGGNATNQCGTGATPLAKVRFTWDNPTSPTGTPQTIRVAYVVVTVGSDVQLHRWKCVNSATVQVDTVLVHNLVSVDSVACASPTTCNSAPNVPQSVTLTMTIRSGSA